MGPATKHGAKMKGVGDRSNLEIVNGGNQLGSPIGDADGREVEAEKSDLEGGAAPGDKSDSETTEELVDGNSDPETTEVSASKKSDPAEGGAVAVAVGDDDVDSPYFSMPVLEPELPLSQTLSLSADQVTLTAVSSVSVVSQKSQDLSISETDDDNVVDDNETPVTISIIEQDENGGEEASSEKSTTEKENADTDEVEPPSVDLAGVTSSVVDEEPLVVTADSPDSINDTATVDPPSSVSVPAEETGATASKNRMKDVDGFSIPAPPLASPKSPSTSVSASASSSREEPPDTIEEDKIEHLPWCTYYLWNVTHRQENLLAEEEIENYLVANHSRLRGKKPKNWNKEEEEAKILEEVKKKMASGPVHNYMSGSRKVYDRFKLNQARMCRCPRDGDPMVMG